MFVAIGGVYWETDWASIDGRKRQCPVRSVWLIPQPSAATRIFGSALKRKGGESEGNMIRLRVAFFLRLWLLNAEMDLGGWGWWWAGSLVFWKRAYCAGETLWGCTKHGTGACSGTAGGILKEESDKYGETFCIQFARQTQTWRWLFDYLIVLFYVWCW